MSLERLRDNRRVKPWLWNPGEGHATLRGTLSVSCAIQNAAVFVYPMERDCGGVHMVVKAQDGEDTVGLGVAVTRENAEVMLEALQVALA